MTSSHKHLSPNQKKWDYSVQKYKSLENPFEEPSLFSILFIACGRPQITKRCLLSSLDSVLKYTDDVEWVFIENGECDENYQLFQELDLERKVVVRQKNYGINHALNQAWALSRGQWCLIHENDWECRLSLDFLRIAKSVFLEKPEVGILQLRAVNDPNENWGYGKPDYSPWSSSDQALSKAGIKVWREQTSDGHTYFVSHFPNGFNNNPTIIAKSLYTECGPYPEPELGTDPRHGETLYQNKVAKTDCAVGHIGLELYFHCGQQTTSPI
jgi:hypothetical protein